MAADETTPIPGGLLIAVEGIDGAGKTTQVNLLAAALQRDRLRVQVSKEPTTGPHGTELRQSAATGRLTPERELQLFLNDRREHVETLIRPALARDEIVILDRYYFSTVAYQQGSGHGIEHLFALNEGIAIKPDLAVILDVPAEVGLGRIGQRGDLANHFETEASLQLARDTFQAMADPPVVVVIDGTQAIEVIHADIVRRAQYRALNKIGKSPGAISEAGLERVANLFNHTLKPEPA